MRPFDRNAFPRENGEIDGNSLVRMIQLYTEKTVNTLKHSPLPCSRCFVNFRKRFCTYHIDNGHTLVIKIPLLTLLNTSTQ